MLLKWKSARSIEHKENRRRYTTALVRLLYRRSGFNALPMIAIGFLGVILLGSLLLTLPVASATGRRIPWFDALFTSTSAVCVTGLVVRDTGTAYSTFGHVVLMLLIDIAPEEVTETLRIAYYYLVVMSLFLPVLYVLHVTRATIQGMGDTVLPMASGIAEFVMRTGAALLLPMLVGDTGIFYAEILAWIGADMILIPSYYYTVSKVDR